MSNVFTMIRFVTSANVYMKMCVGCNLHDHATHVIPDDIMTHKLKQPHASNAHTQSPTGSFDHVMHIM